MPSKSKKITTKKKIEQIARPVDIQAIEHELPPKKKRSNHIVVKLKHLSIQFDSGVVQTTVLKDISFNLYSGEFTIIAGPSGSGKSTLLHSILGLEKPTTGRVELRKEDLYSMSEDKRANHRRRKIGTVFQQSNWIKSLNVWENVSYPLWLFGVDQTRAKERALECLKTVELEDWAYHAPMELSGGQQQRASLARALITDPGIIIADEPTGNLDSTSSAKIISLLAKLNRIDRRLVIMVTHDTAFLPIANRRIILIDGKVAHDEHD